MATLPGVGLSMSFIQQHLLTFCHILMIFMIFHTFPSLLYCDGDHWCYHCNCLGAPQTMRYKTANLTNTCSVHSDRSTDLPFTAFLPFWASYTLRHNIESRPINNPTMASKCSSEMKSLTFLKLNQKLVVIKLSEKGTSKDKTGLKAGL